MRAICLVLCVLGSLGSLRAEPQVIHAFVALCDNDHQGIQKVPAKIGNGDDPANNLYWGCDDGLAEVFGRSAKWKKVAVISQPVKDIVLERRVFRHVATGAWLVADAYRGREIKRCIADYFAALAGTSALEVEAGGVKIAAAGASSLVAYIGHDGLMEFDVTPPAVAAGRGGKAAVCLCCMSQSWFGPKLRAVGARPVLLTTQLMYPGAFLLREAADGWLAGKDPEAIRQLAAAAYARNQKISRQAAAGVFTTRLEAEK